MRNLAAHPITTEEIIECLEKLARELSAGESRFGDMRPILLETAAAILADVPHGVSVRDFRFGLKRHP